MVILDTIFVTMAHRGKGHTKNLIRQLLSSPDVLIFPKISEFPPMSNHSLGFSSPISNGMFLLLIRLIVTEEKSFQGIINHTDSAKERLWLVGDMHDGDQNIWWSAPRMAKERGFDIRKLVEMNS